MTLSLQETETRCVGYDPNITVFGLKTIHFPAIGKKYTLSMASSFLNDSSNIVESVPIRINDELNVKGLNI